MRFPKINATSVSNSINDEIIEFVDPATLDEVEHLLEIDPENAKTFAKVIKTIKTVVRSSFEYKNLMYFLKEHHDFNQTYLYKGVKRTPDKKFSVEVHHTPFVLEDIVVTVINKRMAKGESLKVLHIAEEIMWLHYRQMCGLIPLDKTTHALIHSDACPDLFIPLNFIPMGDFHKFYEDYKKFIPDRALDAYLYIQDLSVKYDRLKDVIPSYMKPKKLYFEGFMKLESFEEVLEAIETAPAQYVVDKDSEVYYLSE